VTVTGVNDGVVDGDVTYTVVTAAAVSGDPGYHGLNPPDASVVNLDNDPGAWDFGDAPDVYGTSLAANGARHEAFGPILGALRDTEPDAAAPLDGTSDDASGQDDEDGVTFTSLLRIGRPATVTVTASAAGLLSAWLDGNADGDWADEGEQIFADRVVQPGANLLTFTVPAGAVVTDRTYARFRLSTHGGLSPVGWAPDGEVEDVAVAIWPSTGTIQGTKWNDLNGNGTREPGEPALAGWTIFLDQNQNGRLDAGELSTQTDDAGDYAFTDLPTGTYVVAELPADGWQQSYPGRHPVTHQRVSVTSSGIQAAGNSVAPAMSADGRFVAFQSSASNLVPGDTGMEDIFVYDRQSGAVERVSVSSLGQQADKSSSSPAISADGRFVAFVSNATNLVPGDTNNRADIFVYDRQTATIQRVSVSSAGDQANADCVMTPAISADGRFVAFMSSATNLVAGDTNNKKDIFVYDRQTDTLELVSRSSGGDLGNNDSENPSLSADGRYVAFDSTASNLVAGDSNFQSDVFVRDRQSGTTQRVSVSASGVQGISGSLYPSLSSDGRYVAFFSLAWNLVAGDSNRQDDIFVYDRDASQIERISVGGDATEANASSWFPAISGDGRFVAYRSIASNLVPGDVNAQEDAFLFDRQTRQVRLLSAAADGGPGNGWSSRPAISGDGRWVAFGSSSSNLVAGDTNGLMDVFVTRGSDIHQAPVVRPGHDRSASRVRNRCFLSGIRGQASGIPRAGRLQCLGRCPAT